MVKETQNLHGQPDTFKNDSATMSPVESNSMVIAIDKSMKGRIIDLLISR